LVALVFLWIPFTSINSGGEHQQQPRIDHHGKAHYLSKTKQWYNLKNIKKGDNKKLDNEQELNCFIAWTKHDTKEINYNIYNGHNLQWWNVEMMFSKPFLILFNTTF